MPGGGGNQTRKKGTLLSVRHFIFYFFQVFTATDFLAATVEHIPPKLPALGVRAQFRGAISLDDKAFSTQKAPK